MNCAIFHLIVCFCFIIWGNRPNHEAAAVVYRQSRGMKCGGYIPQIHSFHMDAMSWRGICGMKFTARSNWCGIGAHKWGRIDAAVDAPLLSFGGLVGWSLIILWAILL